MLVKAPLPAPIQMIGQQQQQQQQQQYNQQQHHKLQDLSNHQLGNENNNNNFQAARYQPSQQPTNNNIFRYDVGASELLSLVLTGGPKWGFRIKLLNDNRVIVSRVDKGSAEKCGLKVNDEILSVNSVQLGNSPRSLLLNDHPEQKKQLQLISTAASVAAAAAAAADQANQQLDSSTVGDETPLLAAAAAAAAAAASADQKSGSGGAGQSHEPPNSAKALSANEAPDAQQQQAAPATATFMRPVELSKLDFAYQLIRHSSLSNKLMLTVRRFKSAAYARASVAAASSSFMTAGAMLAASSYTNTTSNNQQQQMDWQQGQSQQQQQPADGRQLLNYDFVDQQAMETTTTARRPHTSLGYAYNCCDCYCNDNEASGQSADEEDERRLISRLQFENQQRQQQQLQLALQQQQQQQREQQQQQQQANQFVCLTHSTNSNNNNPRQAQQQPQQLHQSCRHVIAGDELDELAPQVPVRRSSRSAIHQRATQQAPTTNKNNGSSLHERRLLNSSSSRLGGSGENDPTRTNQRIAATFRQYNGAPPSAQAVPFRSGLASGGGRPQRPTQAPPPPPPPPLFSPCNTNTSATATTTETDEDYDERECFRRTPAGQFRVAPPPPPPPRLRNAQQAPRNIWSPSSSSIVSSYGEDDVDDAAPRQQLESEQQQRQRETPHRQVLPPPPLLDDYLNDASEIRSQTDTVIEISGGRGSKDDQQKQQPQQSTGAGGVIVQYSALASKTSADVNGDAAAVHQQSMKHEKKSSELDSDDIDGGANNRRAAPTSTSIKSIVAEQQRQDDKLAGCEQQQRNNKMPQPPPPPPIKAAPVGNNSRNQQPRQSNENVADEDEARILLARSSRQANGMRSFSIACATLPQTAAADATHTQDGGAGRRHKLSFCELDGRSAAGSRTLPVAPRIAPDGRGQFVGKQRAGPQSLPAADERALDAAVAAGKIEANNNKADEITTTTTRSNSDNADGEETNAEALLQAAHHQTITTGERDDNKREKLQQQQQQHGEPMTFVATSTTTATTAAAIANSSSSLETADGAGGDKRGPINNNNQNNGNNNNNNANTEQPLQVNQADQKTKLAKDGRGANCAKKLTSSRESEKLERLSSMCYEDDHDDKEEEESRMNKKMEQTELHQQQQPNGSQQKENEWFKQMYKQMHKSTTTTVTQSSAEKSIFDAVNAQQPDTSLIKIKLKSPRNDHRFSPSYFSEEDLERRSMSPRPGKIGDYLPGEQSSLISQHERNLILYHKLIDHINRVFSSVLQTEQRTRVTSRSTNALQQKPSAGAKQFDSDQDDRDEDAADHGDQDDSDEQQQHRNSRLRRRSRRLSSHSTLNRRHKKRQAQNQSRSGPQTPISSKLGGGHYKQPNVSCSHNASSQQQLEHERRCVFNRLLRDEGELNNSRFHGTNSLDRRHHRNRRLEDDDDDCQDDDIVAGGDDGLDGSTPRKQYVAVQQGHDIPLKGLRKPAPQPNIYRVGPAPPLFELPLSSNRSREFAQRLPENQINIDDHDHENISANNWTSSKLDELARQQYREHNLRLARSLGSGSSSNHYHSRQTNQFNSNHGRDDYYYYAQGERNQKVQRAPIRSSSLSREQLNNSRTSRNGTRMDDELWQDDLYRDFDCVYRTLCEQKPQADKLATRSVANKNSTNDDPDWSQEVAFETLALRESLDGVELALDKLTARQQQQQQRQLSANLSLEAPSPNLSVATSEQTNRADSRNTNQSYQNGPALVEEMTLSDLEEEICSNLMAAKEADRQKRFSSNNNDQMFSEKPINIHYNVPTSRLLKMNTFNEFELNRIKRFYADELAERRLQRSRSTRLSSNDNVENDRIGNDRHMSSSSRQHHQPHTTRSADRLIVGHQRFNGDEHDDDDDDDEADIAEELRIIESGAINLKRYQQALAAKYRVGGDTGAVGGRGQQHQARHLPTTASCPRKATSQSHSPPVRFGRAKYDFQAKGGQELSMKRGDLVELLELVEQTKWVRVEDCQSGLQGLVPVDYLDFDVGCAVAKRDISAGSQAAASRLSSPEVLLVDADQAAAAIDQRLQLPMVKGEPIALIRRLDGHLYEASNTRLATGLVWSRDLEIIEQPSSLARQHRPSEQLFGDLLDDDDDDHEFTTTDDDERQSFRHLDGVVSRRPLIRRRMDLRRLNDDLDDADADGENSLNRTAQRHRATESQRRRARSASGIYEPRELQQQQVSTTMPHYHRRMQQQQQQHQQRTTTDSYSLRRSVYESSSKQQRHHHQQEMLADYGGCCCDRKDEQLPPPQQQQQLLLTTRPRRSSSSPLISELVVAAANNIDGTQATTTKATLEHNQHHQAGQLPPHLCRAKFAYKARQKDELDLSVGDILVVVHECDDGWFIGSPYSNRQLVGTFPGNFVERIVAAS